MKKQIGILTSSRADYSIYRPLIVALQNSEEFEPKIIAFGSHTSKEHGYTLQAIKDDGFNVAVTIDCLPADGSPQAISANMGGVMNRFSKVWENEKFDLVFCLGDRFEMFAAVAAALPFNIPMAHLYGGETTAGAIDDALRHCITHMCRWHFTSCEPYRQKVISLIADDSSVFNVGALSFDNLRNLPLLTKEDLSAQTGVDFNKKVVLTTFHPETVGFEKNAGYSKEICEAIGELSDFEFLITLPNNDTANEVIREDFLNLSKVNKHVHCHENLGTVRYLSAMKYCTLMLGNTSSGFVEASWFPAKVLNLGNRQSGRILTKNITNCEIKKEAIVSLTRELSAMPPISPQGIYGDGNSAEKIMFVLLNRIFTN
jgi:GDP/UDP-N,N'-diacetylbacillosamine 2-epimerase (hydrolysing)